MITTIKHRRGSYTDFDPTKMNAGEIALTTSDDPNSADGKAIYMGVGSGSVKRLATADSIEADIAEAIDSVTEQVEGYLEEIEEKGEEVLDSIPSDYTQLSEDVDDLKSDLSEAPGLPEEARNAILACFAHVVWDTPQASGYISLLENALFPSEYPKITTAFNPGTHVVYNVDTLDSLKPYLTVLYFETEESSGTAISNYTLSGELTGGTSRITATYNGLSSKFNVSVVDIDTITSWLYPSDITDKVIGSTQRVSSEDTRCVVNTESTRWIVGNTIAPIKIKDTSLNDMSIAPIKVPDGCTGATVTFTYTGSASDVKYMFTRLKKEDGYYKVITWTSQANSGDRTAFTSTNQYLLLSILSASSQEITPTSVSIVFDSNS